MQVIPGPARPSSGAGRSTKEGERWIGARFARRVGFRFGLKLTGFIMVFSRFFPSFSIAYNVLGRIVGSQSLMILPSLGEETKTKTTRRTKSKKTSLCER